MALGATTGGRALVLGGGGVTGVAWEIGMLLGLAQAGLDLAAADLFIGTSAGSVVAAQLTSGASLDQLYDAQLADASGEIAARMSRAALARFVLAMAWPGNPQRARARLGHAALRAKTVSEAERRSVIAQRLPSHDWPQRRLLIPAVDAETGAVVVFTMDSGVSLVDAVAASCAVPLVWPPMTIGSHRYIDGGVRSVANIDLAAGCERVVVIAPITAGLSYTTIHRGRSVTGQAVPNGYGIVPQDLRTCARWNRCVLALCVQEYSAILRGYLLYIQRQLCSER